jgi:hypothetical protein
MEPDSTLPRILAEFALLVLLLASVLGWLAHTAPAR